MPVTLPPGPIEARDETHLHGIAGGVENDRDSRGRGLRCKCRCAAQRSDDGDLPAHQIGRQVHQPRVVILRPAEVDRHVATFTVAGFVQAFVECRRDARFGPAKTENSDHRQRRLLRPRHERPRDRAAERD